MASILKVDTLTGVSTAGSISVTGEGNSTTTNLQQGLAKAWAHFDGTASSNYLNDSFNHSSITDYGTGNYNPNLSSNMSSVSYSCAGASNMTSSNRGAFRTLDYVTSTITIRIYGNGSSVDASDVSVNFHGDLA